MVYHKVSCGGPQLFSYYTHPITDVIKRYSDVKYHFYADDTQLYICVNPRKPGETDRAISILSNCISEIKNWMSNNMLLLNDDKTEFFVAANPRLMNILSDISIAIHVGDTVIRPSLSVRILHSTVPWLCLVTSLQYAKLLTFMYRTYHVLEFLLMKQHVTTCAIRALVTSRLDYANSLLKGSSCKEISCLQRLQNRAAKLIFMAKMSDHVSPLLEQHHWLPVHKCIDFKIVTIIC